MKTSLVVLFAFAACVAFCGNYAKASILPLGGVILPHHPAVIVGANPAVISAANEAAGLLANSIQEAGNQAVARAQVAADAAGVHAQAVVDAVQASNEKVAAVIEAGGIVHAW